MKNIWKTTSDIKFNIMFYDIFYKDLIKNYSTTYLSGSFWYVGESLKEWWEKSGKIYTYEVNLRKLKAICEFLDTYLEKTYKN